MIETHTQEKEMYKLISFIIGASLVITYVFGIYQITFNDKYDTKEMILAYAFPPYPVWIGGKEIYLKFNTNTDYQYKYEKCLKESFLVPETQRHNLCDCMANSNSNKEMAKNCGVITFN